jgi:hypothetical protein
MKKTLGVLVLTLSALVITAACASTGPPSKPTPPQPDDGQTWSKTVPSERPSRPARSAAVPTARLAE